MIPFPFEDLFSTAKSLMGLIIKQDVLNRIINGRQLQKFDFTKKENFLPLKLMTIGFSAERNMELRRKDVLSHDVINRFMKDCHLIIIGILEKIFEKSLVFWKKTKLPLIFVDSGQMQPVASRKLFFWKQLVASVQSQFF